MPLTAKGEEILRAMEKQYGPEKGKRVLYASKNAGRITGIDASVDACKGYLDACSRGHVGDMQRHSKVMMRGRTVR